MSDETTVEPAGGPAPAPVANLTPPPVATPAVVPEAATPSARLRFEAPADTSAITFSTGRSLSVVDGVLEAPDDLVASERLDLARLGFKAA